MCVFIPFSFSGVLAVPLAFHEENLIHGLFGWCTASA